MERGFHKSGPAGRCSRQRQGLQLQLLTELLQEGFLLLIGEVVDGLGGRAMRHFLLRTQEFAEHPEQGRAKTGAEQKLR